MRRLASFGIAFMVAAVCLPCVPGLHHDTTRSEVTLSSGETAQTEVHTHFNADTTLTTFATIDARGKTFAGVHSGNKKTLDYTIRFWERPRQPVLLSLSYNLGSLKDGKPTAVEVGIRGQKYNVTIDPDQLSRDQTAQLAKIKRMVGRLPRDFQESLRTAYALSGASLSGMPSLAMLYYVVDNLPEGLTGVERPLDDLQTKAFKAQFADEAEPPPASQRPPRAKDIPEP